jgi:hypothetical protein
VHRVALEQGQAVVLVVLVVRVVLAVLVVLVVLAVLVVVCRKASAHRRRCRALWVAVGVVQRYHRL